MLMREVSVAAHDNADVTASDGDADGDGDDSINYHEFCEALRAGRIRYLGDVQSSRRRLGPDPEQPFGDSKQNNMPFGLMRDAERNLDRYVCMYV